MMEKQKYLNNIYEKYEIERKQKRKSEFYQEKFKKAKIRVLEMVAMFLVAIGITIGVGYSVSNDQQNEPKVWKEPKQYTSLEEINSKYQKDSFMVSEQEKKQLISEKEAQQKAIDFMGKLGYEKQEIKRTKLLAGVKNEQDPSYMVKTLWEYEGGLEVDINAKTGEIMSFHDFDLKYKHSIADQISEQQATQIAKEIYQRTGLFSPNEYSFKKIEEIPHYFQNQGTNEWTASFSKKYDGAFNSYETVSITFFVLEGETKIDTIKIQRVENFEDNPVKLTKEEATQIAKEMDRKIEQREIAEIETQLSIEYMNAFVYLQERSQGKDDGTRKETLPDGTQAYYNAFETEKRLRKVWKVIIHYKDSKDDNKQEKQYDDREYYVDATTMEIIGGRWY